MKKHLTWFALIIVLAFIFSQCSKSSTGPTPDFKYLGTWIGQNNYADSVEVRVANVSNKQKVTYIKLIAAAKFDSVNYVFSVSSGLTEVTDTTFSYTEVMPGIWDTTTVTINGAFESETQLSGSFNITSTDDPPIAGTYTATKQ